MKELEAIIIEHWRAGHKLQKLVDATKAAGIDIPLDQLKLMVTDTIQKELKKLLA